MGDKAIAEARSDTNSPDLPPLLAAYFAECPPGIRARLLDLRTLVYRVAAEDTRIGPLQETLKWGEPSYLTATSRSGTTLRLARKKALPDTYGLFFNCQTSLAQQISELFPHTFILDGKRGLLFSVDENIPVEKVKSCISLVLTYRLGGIF